MPRPGLQSTTNFFEYRAYHASRRPRKLKTFSAFSPPWRLKNANIRHNIAPSDGVLPGSVRAPSGGRTPCCQNRSSPVGVSRRRPTLPLPDRDLRSIACNNNHTTHVRPLMDSHELKALLEGVSDGRIAPGVAAERIQVHPYQEAGDFAKVDLHRRVRVWVSRGHFRSGKDGRTDRGDPENVARTRPGGPGDAARSAGRRPSVNGFSLR